MSKPNSTKTFEQLQELKEELNHAFPDYCKKRWGREFYNQYVSPIIENTLENLEEQIEIVAERSIEDEELSYADFSQE